MNAHRDGEKNIIDTYLMAGYRGYKAATQFTCVDKSVEQIQGSGSNSVGYHLHTVEARYDCGANFLPCAYLCSLH